MLKSGRKGWVKIVEAVMAILLIAGVLMFFYSKTYATSERTARVYELEKAILDEIAGNPEMREKVLAGDLASIEGNAREKIEQILPGFSVKMKICEPEVICSLEFYNKEAYASERIVSATLSNYNPKKIKVFMWRE